MIPNITISVSHELYSKILEYHLANKVSLSKAAQYYLRLGVVRSIELERDSD